MWQSCPLGQEEGILPFTSEVESFKVSHC